LGQARKKKAKESWIAISVREAATKSKLQVTEFHTLENDESKAHTERKDARNSSELRPQRAPKNESIRPNHQNKSSEKIIIEPTQRDANKSKLKVQLCTEGK
jgi:hypothetical protein